MNHSEIDCSAAAAEGELICTGGELPGRSFPLTAPCFDKYCTTLSLPNTSASSNGVRDQLGRGGRDEHCFSKFIVRNRTCTIIDKSGEKTPD